MAQTSFRTLLVNFLLFSLLFGSIDVEFSKANHAPARQSASSFPDSHATTLVAYLDGAINLVYRDSGKIIWSFASGSPIYSSYQAPINHEDENASASGDDYFVDCGDDWKLFAHTDLGKVRMDMSMKEFIEFSPLLSNDGRVILGSKKTTVFMVDAYIGRLIRVLDSSTDATNTSPNIITKQEEKQPDKQLSFTRTDYLLTSFAANSNKVLWNVTVADIDVVLLCQENPNSHNGPLLSLHYDHHSKSHFSFDMPLSCQSKAVVHRLRSPDGLESFRNRDISEPIVLMMLLSQIEVIFFIMKETRNEDILTKLERGDIHLETEGFSSSSVSQDPQDERECNYIVNKFDKRRTAISVPLIVIAFLVYCHPTLTAAMLKLNAKYFSTRWKKIVNDDGNAEADGEQNSILNPKHSVECDVEGQSIGKLVVSSKKIAKGRDDTVFFEGRYEGCDVVVKRLVKAHHGVADKEYKDLFAYDNHPNIVRFYGVEEDDDFVYLSFERCDCSLYDLIQKLGCSNDQAENATTSGEGCLDTMNDIMHEVHLWKSNGYPTTIFLQLMRDIVSGLVHLHGLGNKIIHGNLKPQNVLIVKRESKLCGKLSDMRISSLGRHASGWQAPEQLLQRRQTCRRFV